MRIIFTIIFFKCFLQILGQTRQLEKIENEIRKNSVGEKFDKQIIDLNNDGKDDIIYTYQCGEPACIKVLLNADELYNEIVNEPYISYHFWIINGKIALHLSLSHCCGESPFLSNRLFGFNQTSTELLENYVTTNDNYTGNEHLLKPLIYSTNLSYGKVSVDNYNLRFSPSIEKLSEKIKETFIYACEDETNIIAKIKMGSTIKILSELIEKDRKWIFVEVDNNSIVGTYNPISFDFKDQKLRGWISDKYIKRQ